MKNTDKSQSSAHEAPSQALKRDVAPKGGFQATWLYRQLLKGRPAKMPSFDCVELWPGDPEIGRQILTGLFCFEGECHQVSSPTKVPQNTSAAWLNWFHGLGWLTHIKALGGTDEGAQAPYFAREWLTDWMEANTTWAFPAWSPPVTARRLINLARAWSFLLNKDSSTSFTKNLRVRVARDARHIFRTVPDKDQGYQCLVCLKGQFFAAFTFLHSEKWQQTALLRLEDEINRQILPDGGHIERNPHILALVIQDLLECKAFSATALGHIPDFILQAIDRSAPMLRSLRHLDGGLALFNGAQEGDPHWLDQLLSQTDPKTTPPLNAPYSGFQRLQAGATTLIMDCGKPGDVGRHQHGGTLSFEMSVNKNRLIVNCGTRVEEHDPWRTALAATAAHSTLTVNDTSSAAFAIDGTLRRGPDHVTCDRKTSVETGTLVETSHDGYLNTFGLKHERALFLNTTGDDVRGEDRLVGTGGEYLTIRFHLHPDVQAVLLGNGRGILLRFGNKRKETWKFRASSGDIKIEPSIYLGHAGDPRRTEQMVISNPLSGNGGLIKWSLSRERQAKS